MKKEFTFVLFLVLLLISLALPLVSASPETKSSFSNPVFYIIISAIWLVVWSIIIVFIWKNPGNNAKKIIFWLITLPIVASSLFLAGNTIYQNIISETGGPIHWHADYEVHVCGQKLDLVDPKFPSNKVGTPKYHEHDDDRVHYEGTPRKLTDVTLGEYFRVIDGKLGSNPGHLIYPTNDAVQNYKDGDTCPDGSVGTLKVYINGKLADDPENYIIYPDPLVPPGDCVIVIFDESNEQTTKKVCSSWEVQGWSYDNFERREVTIAGHTWQ